MKFWEYIDISEKQLENNFKIHCNYHLSKEPKSPSEYWDLNQFGNACWELVSVTSTFENGTHFYFKREKI